MNADKRIRPNVKTIDIISYDFDGTLIDSIPDITVAMNKTLGEYRFPSVTEENMTTFVGDGIPLMVERALKAALDSNNSKDLFNQYYQQVLNRYKILYGEHCTDKSRLYPGVPEILFHFSRKIQILITNKAESITRKMLEHYKLDGFFDLMIGGDSLPQRKPHPSIMEYVREKYGKELSVCHVGDSHVDVKTAQNAGALSIAALWGYSPEDVLRKSNPDYLIKQIHELKNIIA